MENSKFASHRAKGWLVSQVHRISTPSFLGEISLGERSFGICKA